MLLLDSDVLIDIQRGHAPALAWYSGLSELPGVPGYVVMELVQDARDEREVQQALRLISPLGVVWLGAADCDSALDWFKTYRLSHGIGLLDSLIAACAIGQGARLCTFNAKHYGVVPGLTTVQPYDR